MKSLFRDVVVRSMLVAFAVAGGCGRINPTAPSWEVEVNIPLLDNNVFLADFIGAWAWAKGDSTGASIVIPQRLTSPVRPINLPRINSGASSGKIEYLLENTLPLTIDSAAIYLGPDSASLFQEPLVVIGPLDAVASVADSNGNAVPTFNSLSVTLTSSQMETLTSSGSRIFGGYTLKVRIDPGSLPPADSLAHVRNLAVATILRRIN